jgi:phosphoglucosamine mutase
MEKLFGTDGIRGKANIYPLTTDMITKIGMAIGTVLKQEWHKNNIVIGKDTRLSGYMIEDAMAAGLTAVGVNVLLLGPIPTPGLAFLTKTMNNDIGIMISDYHNPYHDNGIKLFDGNGIKFPDEIENKIEECLKENSFMENLVFDDKIGRRVVSEHALYQQRYIQYLKSTCKYYLSDLKVVLDMANGASYKIAPFVFSELEADIICIANTPNGININKDCGSTDVRELRKNVLQNNYDIGIAFDGDADRVIMVDENGNEIDGDKIIAAITTDMFNKGTLNKNTVVVTQMSNYGFEKYMNSIGVNVVRTKVGDRYVAEEMRNNDYNIGGEQSGHVILSDYSTTGDGEVTALQILSLMKEQKIKASDILNLYQSTPQILVNIAYEKNDKNPINNDKVRKVIEEYENKLLNNGRILIRKSGTQSLIRVMVESSDEKLMNETIDKITKTIREAM